MKTKETFVSGCSVCHRMSAEAAVRYNRRLIMPNGTPECGSGEKSNPQSPLGETHAYLTKLDVAKLFQVEARTIDTWMQAGFLPYLKIGRTVRFYAEDIRSHLTEKFRKIGAGGPPVKVTMVRG